jgi:hypothetical protein
MPRTGRPASFRARARFVLYVEAHELERLHRAARAAGNPSTSAWSRAVLLEMTRHEESAATPASATRGRPRCPPRGRARATAPEPGGQRRAHGAAHHARTAREAR